MKWDELLDLIGSEPLFESSQLLAGTDSPGEIRRQLSRWTAAGRVIQLRRGLYLIAPPHAKVQPSPFTVASRLRRPSYVSMQSALAYHGLIPESVPVVTSVTTARPGRLETPLGTFSYRHVQQQLFWGYGEEEAVDGQSCFVAQPEKALIDLFYLTPGRITQSLVEELRLEASEGFDCDRLMEFAQRAGKPRLIQGATVASRLLRSQSAQEVEH
jgi:predicted transcriptional regulator of viral defense system